LALIPNVKWALWSCHPLELLTVKLLLRPHIERYLPLNPTWFLARMLIPCADADVEGEVSQTQLTLFLPPNLQFGKSFSKIAKGDYLQ
jgi:hypothetical protein